MKSEDLEVVFTLWELLCVWARINETVILLDTGSLKLSHLCCLIHACVRARVYISWLLFICFQVG